MLKNEIENLLLRLFLFTLALADVDQFCISSGEFQDAGTYQAVVQNDVAFGDNARRLQGQQFRVAGSGADEVKRSGFRCATRQAIR